MKNHIAEDLPARKFAPAPAASSAPVNKNNKKENSGKTPEERAKQAVYDIRYKAKRDEIPLIKAYTEYMKNSSIPGQERDMIKAKLFGKVSGGMRAEDFNPIFKNAASDNVAKALFKVFVEKKEINIEDLKEFYTRRNSGGELVFHVRITDKKTGDSYTRDVTREKLSKLRANPNIDIEMSEYRKDSEIERTRGALTARVAAGKGLDYDGDGNVESGAKEYRGAVHNAIQRKKGGAADGKDTSSVREDFIHEAGRKKKSKKKKSDKLDVRTDIRNKVNTSPTQGGNERVGLMAHNELEGELIAETGYSKFLDMIQEKKLTKAEKAKKEQIVKSLKPKYGKTSKTYAIATSVAKKVAEEMDCGSDDNKKKGEEEDPRSMKTKVNLVKNKLRAMGLKMSYEPEGNQIDEIAPLVAGGLALGAAALGAKAISDRMKGDRTGSGKVRPNTIQSNFQKKRAAEAELMSQSYEPEGEMIDERRRQDKGTPRKPRDKAFELVAKSMGTNRLGVRPRGEKKDRTSPVEAAPPEITPAQKVAKNRASRERGNEMMRDTRGT